MQKSTAVAAYALGCYTRRAFRSTVECAAHKHFRFQTAALSHLSGYGILPLLATLFAPDVGLRRCRLRLQASERERCQLRTYGQLGKLRS
jgi:hypothetical protein